MTRDKKFVQIGCVGVCAENTVGVYFIQTDGVGTPIKIGVSTDVKSRFQALDCVIPDNLTLLAVIEGEGYDFEQQAHWVFREYRRKNEWFHPGPRLEKFVAKIQASGLWSLREYCADEDQSEYGRKSLERSFAQRKKTKRQRKEMERQKKSELSSSRILHPDWEPKAKLTDEERQMLYLKESGWDYQALAFRFAKSKGKVAKMVGDAKRKEMNAAENY